MFKNSLIRRWSNHAVGSESQQQQQGRKKRDRKSPLIECSHICLRAMKIMHGAIEMKSPWSRGWHWEIYSSPRQRLGRQANQPLQVAVSDSKASNKFAKQIWSCQAARQMLFNTNMFNRQYKQKQTHFWLTNNTKQAMIDRTHARLKSKTSRIFQGRCCSERKLAK